MFKKILIANRGEIACRVIRSARDLSVATVAVYSDADRHSLHVSTADEAVHIGPAPVAESYLKADRIIAAALATGAEAIHPGYGFLSENPDFVDLVEKAGLVFIGPSSEAIRAMGLKDAAKRLMEKAGVPVVPGYFGDRQESDFLKSEADAIGYPVLIKARAGGGGKGMRRVDRPEDFAAALEGAQREAANAFGDSVCMIEKYILAPRHIEIQVFGDNHGNAVHLFERDCSLQRRHQKVVEESPAPGMTDIMRAAMGDAAVRAAKAIGYSGAGTVEFIVDASDGLQPDRFWFMEMNTRLQVEHPVTEEVTGQDLVALQLRVAAGGKLPFRQEDIVLTGHAIEARLYAEDPARGFLPAIGMLEHLTFSPHARIETGVRQGDAVTPHYDPMIAKIIVRGPDRAAALARLETCLNETEVSGLSTNLAFLSRLIINDNFVAEKFDTGLIDRELETLTAKPPVPAEVVALAALYARKAFAAPSGNDPWSSLYGFRNFGRAESGLSLVIDGEATTARTAFSANHWQVTAAERTLVARIIEKGESPLIEIDGHTIRPVFIPGRDMVTLLLQGRSYNIRLPDFGTGGDGHQASDSIVSPMPGTVQMVMAKAGDTVQRGQPLIVVEAMKMEHTLTAPRDGIIADILASALTQVEDGTLLLTLVEE